MDFNKEFIRQNFSLFLSDNRKFFFRIKPIFIKLFLKYINNLTNKKLNIKKDEISLFYNELFLKPFIEEKNYTHINNIFLHLNNYNININLIFNKIFTIIINYYIKHKIKTSNPISHIYQLTSLLEFYIRYFEHYKSDIEDIYFELPKEIFYIFQSKTPLQLFTIFKGIPITHKTYILNLDKENNNILVSANRYQIIASTLQQDIFLLENDKEYSFKAKIAKVDKQNRQMLLTNIQKVQRNALKRNFIRVQPKDKIFVEIKKENIVLKTELYDISLKGLCVIAEKTDFLVGDTVALFFNIKMQKNHLFLTQGEIKSITKINNDNYKYHIYFELPTNDEYFLSKYISSREKEILKELNEYINQEFFFLDE